MTSETREFVRRRAGSRCEYCLLPAEHSGFGHHIAHVVARRHGGSSDPSNLALSCHHCNQRKGPDLSGFDPVSRELTWMFHPRLDEWSAHFRFDGVAIVALTPVGRATVELLAMNSLGGLARRRELLSLGALRETVS